MEKESTQVSAKNRVNTMQQPLWETVSDSFKMKVYILPVLKPPHGSLVQILKMFSDRKDLLEEPIDVLIDRIEKDRLERAVKVRSSHCPQQSTFFCSPKPSPFSGRLGRRQGVC